MGKQAQLKEKEKREAALASKLAADAALQAEKKANELSEAEKVATLFAETSLNAPLRAVPVSGKDRKITFRARQKEVSLCLVYMFNYLYIHACVISIYFQILERDGHHGGGAGGGGSSSGGHVEIRFCIRACN